MKNQCRGGGGDSLKEGGRIFEGVVGVVVRPQCTLWLNNVVKFVCVISDLYLIFLFISLILFLMLLSLYHYIPYIWGSAFLVPQVLKLW